MESATCEVSRADVGGLIQNVQQNSWEVGLVKKKFVLALLFPLLFGPLLLGAPKFYDDDPLEKEPTPLHVENAKFRKLNDYYDLFHNTLAKPGERQPKRKKRRQGWIHPSTGGQHPGRSSWQFVVHQPGRLPAHEHQGTAERAGQREWTLDERQVENHRGQDPRGFTRLQDSGFARQQVCDEIRPRFESGNGHRG